MTLSPQADAALTETLKASWGRLEINARDDGRIVVWLPHSKNFDKPDGVGDTVLEALDDAARKVKLLLTLNHRESKRSKIYRFFEANMDTKFSSKYLHDTFGSSFRTRVSEVNRDSKSQITIRNEYVYDDLAKQEVSSYWSEPRN